MPVARCGDHRRDVASIVLCGPESIGRDLNRRQPDPLAAGSAIVVEVEAGMIDQDRQTTSDQHRRKKKVEEVAVVVLCLIRDRLKAIGAPWARAALF